MKVFPVRSLRSSYARAAVAVTGLLLLVCSLAGSDPTVAAWQDDTHAQGTISAKTLPIPSGSCAYSSTFGNRIFTFTWAFPPGSGYSLNDVQFVRDRSLTDPTLIEVSPFAISTSGPSSSGNYTTTINANNGPGFFFGMYSDTRAFKLGLRSTEGGWFSEAATANVRLNASNFGGTCAG